MAAPVPSTEPSTITAGDTIAWTKTLSDYPSTVWTLSYAFRAEDGSALLNITATPAAADTFAATIPAASSNTMKPGPWAWRAAVSAAGERHTVAAGLVTVAPNFSNVNFTADLRTPAKLAYDNALAAWQGVKLGQTVTLNGRTYTQHNLDTLIRYVDRCRADYQRERDAEKFAQTGVNPRQIRVRFNRV